MFQTNARRDPHVHLRDGAMSLRAHRALFDAYDGPKREFTGRVPDNLD